MFNINWLPSWWSFIPHQRRRRSGTSPAADLFWIVLIVLAIFITIVKTMAAFLAWLGHWNLLIVPVAVVALVASLRWTQRELAAAEVDDQRRSQAALEAGRSELARLEALNDNPPRTTTENDQ